MRSPRLRSLAAVISLASACLPAGATGPFAPRDQHVWPLSGSQAPSLPFSSTYGPRAKSSDNSRYDWHRGVDMPTPCNTPVHAIRAGVVRMSGDYPGTYSDRMVQICHPRPGAPASVCGQDADNDGLMDDANGDGRVDGSVSPQAYYSVYLHLASADVVVGQQVAAGDVVAHTGDSGIGYSGNCQSGSAGGFDHLHFELRDGGVTSADAVHPLLVLPYAPPADALAVAFNGVDLAAPAAPVVQALVTAPASAPHFNRLELRVFDHVNGSPVQVAFKALDLMAWTRAHSTSIDRLDTAPGYTGQYVDAAVFGPDMLGMTVAPGALTNDGKPYRLHVGFEGLAGGADAARLSFELRAYDIDGRMVRAVQGPAAGGGDPGGPVENATPVPVLGPAGLVGLPLLLAVAGGLRWFRRQRRGQEDS